MGRRRRTSSMAAVARLRRGGGPEDGPLAATARERSSRWISTSSASSARPSARWRSTSPCFPGHGADVDLEVDEVGDHVVFRPPCTMFGENVVWLRVEHGPVARFRPARVPHSVGSSRAARSSGARPSASRWLVQGSARAGGGIAVTPTSHPALSAPAGLRRPRPCGPSGTATATPARGPRTGPRATRHHRVWPGRRPRRAPRDDGSA